MLSTDKQTNQRYQKHNLLCHGGNYLVQMCSWTQCTSSDIHQNACDCSPSVHTEIHPFWLMLSLPMPSLQVTSDTWIPGLKVWHEWGATPQCSNLNIHAYQYGSHVHHMRLHSQSTNATATFQKTRVPYRINKSNIYFFIFPYIP